MGLKEMNIKEDKFLPRLIAFEVTRTCNLDCIHCRAAASKGPYEGELTTEEIFRILEEIREVSQPIIILTGGEPLLREDIFDIAKKCIELKLKPVLATNGTLITEKIAQKIKNSKIARVSISLDGATKETHDNFRKMPGAFEGAIRGIEILKKQGIPFQINTTITGINVEELPKIHELVINLGAIAHHIFVLVPVGRGKEISKESITPEKYEEILTWFYGRREKSHLQLKATCAPTYYRILREKAKAEGKKVTFETFGLDAITRGCLAGTGFCFISHIGIVQPCGYLEISCGDLRKQTFKEVWESSEIFNNLRDFTKYKGKCGKCEYIRICGGCRARAYEATGDYLEEEPLCLYEPIRSKIIFAN
ncbi:Radical SAM domain protein [Thermodesulfobacterium geofontis OPF15]|jgi:heme b synthase|uniref:Radical SAM domain protein n=1 Tax=Thermodesulfobacterium geofontis (strain OPF15) TaxID=795359 RepID=F8C3Y7_THEGP|nr:heme b synthase [Thermodesulfobacterium geofontis]AEH22525.1 Radical SAM domain protein [Thermodesulfobacterium geofontis OPF15]